MNLKGKVLDEFGNSVVGATVEVWADGGSAPAATTTTSSDGVWSFSGLNDTVLYTVIISYGGAQVRKMYGGIKVQLDELSVKSCLTLANAGVLTLPNKSITTSMIADKAITGDKLAAKSVITQLVTVTSNYTVPDWGYHIDVNASGGAVTITLPTAASNAGALIEVRKTDSSTNTVTIDGYSSETINGSATLVIYSQYDSYSLRSDGTNVMVV